MSRSIMDVEDELMRLWGLVGELSEQLSNNRALVTQLKARSENVKGQAVHVGTGFPLRRFNLDITNEEFQSELEAFSSHLVLENQQLQHENKQLNALLKEYEQTLETVMGKFRGIAHSSQQHDLSLHSYYTSLLQTLQTAHSSAQLHDSTSLSLLLNRLSTLLRSALRSLQGEDPDVDLASLLPTIQDGLAEVAGGMARGSRGESEGPLFRANSGTLPLSSGGEGSSEPRAASSPSPDSPSESWIVPTTSTSPTAPAPAPGSTRTLPRAPAKPVRFPGFMPGTSGGYAGTEGQPDWALEREMEILRLEEENRALREMLCIAEETVIPAAGEHDEGEDKEEGDESPSVGDRSRKSSLTVDELEAGAAQEADEKAKSGEQGAETGGAQGAENGQGAAGLLPMFDAGQAAPAPSPRPLLTESVLGFQTDIPPPEEAIVDELDGEPELVAPLQGGQK
ncbi:hypothetical protein IAT38_003405 [Cryptococcus sp. DSM 104549]